MPEYAITITKTAQKQLNKLPDDVAETLIAAIQNLSHNPGPHSCKKLKGRNGYRVREGNYPIIYDILDRELLIDVIAIGHRKDIYE